MPRVPFAWRAAALAVLTAVATACLPVGVGPGAGPETGPPPTAVVVAPKAGVVSVIGRVGATSGPPATAGRDCGHAVGLPHDRILWIFCDTVWRPAPDKEAFLTATAALATTTAPTRTQDYSTTNGYLHNFLPPTTQERAVAVAAGGYHALWTTSAFAVGETVYAFYRHVDVLGAYDYRMGSVGVSRLDMQGRAPRTALRATRIADSLPGLSRQWGMAATYAEDGFVYLYSCPRHESCLLARALPGDLGQPVNWEFFGAGRWVLGTESAATPLPMPGAQPVAGVAVEWIPSIGRYVMAYTASPGFTTTAQIRWADRPQGPWSEPVAVPLPDCEADLANACYAVSVHPELSSGSRVGLTWFDRGAARDTGDGYGRLIAGRVGLD
jgi:hypothetical protein